MVWCPVGSHGAWYAPGCRRDGFQVTRWLLPSVGRAGVVGSSDVDVERIASVVGGAVGDGGNADRVGGGGAWFAFAAGGFVLRVNCAFRLL